MTFTLEQFYVAILGCLTFIITLGGAIGYIAKVIAKAKEPEKKQNEKIEKLEKELTDLKSTVNSHASYFNDVKGRTVELEKGNLVLMKSILALMSHAIDGNHTAELTAARDSLNEYLLGGK